VRITARESKKRVAKKYIMSECVFKARYSFFLKTKMYRSAEIILYQWLKYNLKEPLQSELTVEDIDIIIMHLILICDFSSVMYILPTIGGNNYYSVGRKNINSLALQACENKDYEALYKICQAYIGDTEMLSVGNLSGTISVLPLTSQLIILKMINNPNTIRN